MGRDEASPGRVADELGEPPPSLRLRLASALVSPPVRQRPARTQERGALCSQVIVSGRV